MGGGGAFLHLLFAPLSNPSISRGLNFPPFRLLLSFHFLLTFSRFQVTTLIGRREPVSSSRHPSTPPAPPPSENHQLSSSPSTPHLSSPFHRSIFNASSTIYLPIKIKTLCHASVFSAHRLRSSCLSMLDRRRFISPPTSSTLISISLNLRVRDRASFFCCTVRTPYANLKAIIPQKEPARLSVPSDLIAVIIFYSINPLFPLFQPGFFRLFDERAGLICANMTSRCSKIAEGLTMFLLSCKVQHLGGPVGGCLTLRPS